MKRHKVLEDNKSEFFLEPIPRWITHFGFGLMVAIFLAILTFTAVVNHPRTIIMEVTVSPDSVIAEADFDVFQQITQGQKVAIRSPFSDLPIEGKAEVQKAWGNANKIYIPIEVNQQLIQNMPIRNKLLCKGEVILYDASLLEKIIKF
ncbi:MAG: hypothetical protein D6730_01480 [Bacteroidetes bacterium]|nr:MAG: hypothetical protein D6730_01480 [Bacteroidota bacterium]